MLGVKFYAYFPFNGELRPLNVIREDLIDKVKKEIRKNDKYEHIKDVVKMDLMYHYWSKCECEFVVSQWTGKDFERKVDVWQQLEPNLDLITKMIILYVAPRKGRKIISETKM